MMSSTEVEGATAEGSLDMIMAELENSVGKLRMKDSSWAGISEAMSKKLEMISKLEAARLGSSQGKRATARAAWREEVNLEVEKRAQYQRKMEGVPLEQVKDWKDKVAMSKMSGEWREGLKGQRSDFLFNEVFSVVYKNPGLIISLNDMLSCRAVSKEWKQSVDNCITTTFDFNTKYRNSAGVFCLNDLPLCLHKFFSLPEVILFNRWSENAYRGSNPFIFRKLVIGLPAPPGAGNAGYWSEMGKMLERWGGEVHQLYLLFQRGPPVGEDLMYESLVKYLSFMPNLRVLLIYEPNRSQMLATEAFKDLRSDIYGPLKEQIAKTTLPELPHLRLVFFNDFVLPPVIHAFLTKYGQTLEDVHVLGRGREKDPGEFGEGKDLPRLKLFCTLSELGRMPLLTYNFPMVEEMSLEYYNLKGGAEVENIFKTLNSCGSSLRNLNLTMNSTLKGAMTVGAGKLELPHLEWTIISMPLENLRNMDFLLPCLSLKELDFKMVSKALCEKKTVPSSPDEIIQFNEYIGGRFYESNIWKLLPELRLVSFMIVPELPTEEWARAGGEAVVRRILYTREGYRKYQQEQTNAINVEGTSK